MTGRRYRRCDANQSSGSFEGVDETLFFELLSVRSVEAFVLRFGRKFVKVVQIFPPAVVKGMRQECVKALVPRLGGKFVEVVQIIQMMPRKRRLIATFRVTRLTLQTRKLWCRDRPARHLGPARMSITKIKTKQNKKCSKKSRKQKK